MGKKSKKIVSLVLSMVLVISMVMPVSAAEYANITETASFRTGAGSSYSLIQNLDEGTEVQILSRSGSWTKIKYEGKTGYVYSTYLKSIIIKRGVVKVGSSGLTIRSKASSSGSSLGKLYSGTKVDIVDETTSYYKIDYNRKTAYVLKKYVVLVEDCDNTMKTSSSLSVRKDPSSTYSKIGSLTKYQILKVKGKCANGWYEIDYGNKTGYISGKYLKEVAEGSLNSNVIGTAKNINTGNLSVRSGRGSSYKLLDKVPQGGEVYVLKDSSSTSWTKIRYKNLTGYVYTKYLDIKLFNTAPVIEAQNISINYGQAYDNSMLNATATDVDDGVLTSQIVYSGDVDTSKVGEYKIELSVVNSKGIKVTKIVTVSVKALIPTIKAVDKIDMHVKSSLENSKFKASALDCEGNSIAVTIDKSAVNLNKPGTYTAVVSATDKWGNKATKNVSVVLVNDAPVVNAKNISINIGDAYKNSMIGGIANDTEDGSLTANLKYSGSVNTNKVGDYTVKVMATDSCGATGETTVTVSVKPVAPTINSVASLKISSTEALNNSLFKASALDCEGNSIAVKIDKSAVNMNKAGTYTVVISATDKWGLKTTKNVEVTVEIVYTANSEAFRKIVRDEMYRLVNEHRANNNATALTVNEDIQNTAYVKSKHMSDNDYFDHSYNGQMIWEHEDVAEAHGENIALSGIYLADSVGLTEQDGLEMAAHLFDLWKNSPGHNANMLNKEFVYIGFDVYLKEYTGSYWDIYATQEFKYGYDF